MAGAYPILNRDLLYTAAMCHDIGKTRELSPFPENDYTDDGQLLGHIVIGVEMMDDAIRTIPDFPGKLASELKHCILGSSRRIRIRLAKETGAGRGVRPELRRLRRRKNADADRDFQG